MRFLCAATVLLTGCLFFMYAQPSPQTFTGGEVTKLGDDSNPSIVHIRFGPGARTNWHTHSRGQIILAEEGVTLTQVKGGPVIELHPGETTYVGPGVAHWHGASPSEASVQYNINRGDLTWLGPVTDAEYKVRPRRP
jgi:quercetin dioxygenase-like cupin family protein